MSDEIIGFKTVSDGKGGSRCEPLLRSEGEELLKKIEQERAQRKSQMPDEQAALRMFCSAWQRLKELGWNDIIYCPKDGSLFEAIEAGSTGIHLCSYDGVWPDGHWWIHEDGDMSPSHPVLFRLPQKS